MALSVHRILLIYGHGWISLNIDCDNSVASFIIKTAFDTGTACEAV